VNPKNTKKDQNKKGSPEPVKQYIPIAQIKRLSLMKGERVLHL